MNLSPLPKLCAWCAQPMTEKPHKPRFCGRSCSAKWRMRQPEHLAKVHTPEVAAKRGAARRAWFAQGGEKAEAERRRIAALNPTSRPEVREKLSRVLKAMGHGPSVRGGNGRGMTHPQKALLDVLCGAWTPEFALSLGPRTPGYPTHYKIDLADAVRKVAIEVDGLSHVAMIRREQDARKEARLRDMGWTVLRFSNRDIRTWIDTGMPTESSISTILAAHGIRVSRSPAR